MFINKKIFKMLPYKIMLLVLLKFKGNIKIISYQKDLF